MSEQVDIQQLMLDVKRLRADMAAVEAILIPAVTLVSKISPEVFNSLEELLGTAQSVANNTTASGGTAIHEMMKSATIVRLLGEISCRLDHPLKASPPFGTMAPKS